MKNIPHKYHLEPETKDSYKFLEAGCAEVFLVAGGEIVNMQRNDKEGKIFSILKAKSADSDFVLLEGLCGDGIPVIEVFDSQKNEAPKFPSKDLCALISDKKNVFAGEIPVFDLDDIESVTKFMEDYYG